MRAVGGEVDGIHIRDRAGVAAERAQCGDVVHGSGAVRRPAERRDARAIGEQRGECIGVDDAHVRIDCDLAHGHAAILGREQPGRNVGVVVKAGHQHLVARPELTEERPRGVHRERGHVRAEDDLARLGAEEGRGLRAGILEHVPGCDRRDEGPAEVGVRVAVVGGRPRRRRTGAPACRRGCRGTCGLPAATGSLTGSDPGEVGLRSRSWRGVYDAAHEACHPWRRTGRIRRRNHRRASGRRGHPGRGHVARRELHDDRRDPVQDAAHDRRRDARGGPRRGGRARLLARTAVGQHAPDARPLPCHRACTRAGACASAWTE